MSSEERDKLIKGLELAEYRTLRRKAMLNENVVSSISESKATEMIKKQVNNGTELVLDMASNIASQLNGHYSHSSHRSHSSHSSHRSHYSSR